MVVIFTKDGNNLILAIENSTQLEKVNVSHIFAKSVSIKGEGRGIGLVNVKHILKKRIRGR